MRKLPSLQGHCFKLLSRSRLHCDWQLTSLEHSWRQVANLLFIKSSHCWWSAEADGSLHLIQESKLFVFLEMSFTWSSLQCSKCRNTSSSRQISDGSLRFEYMIVDPSENYLELQYYLSTFGTLEMLSSPYLTNWMTAAGTASWTSVLTWALVYTLGYKIITTEATNLFLATITHTTLLI